MDHGSADVGNRRVSPIQFGKAREAWYPCQVSGEIYNHIRMYIRPSKLGLSSASLLQLKITFTPSMAIIQLSFLWTWTLLSLSLSTITHASSLTPIIPRDVPLVSYGDSSPGLIFIAPQCTGKYYTTSISLGDGDDKDTRRYFEVDYSDILQNGTLFKFINVGSQFMGYPLEDEGLSSIRRGHIEMVQEQQGRRRRRQCLGIDQGGQPTTPLCLIDCSSLDDSYQMLLFWEYDNHSLIFLGRPRNASFQITYTLDVPLPHDTNDTALQRVNLQTTLKRQPCQGQSLFTPIKGGMAKM